MQMSPEPPPRYSGWKRHPRSSGEERSGATLGMPDGGDILVDYSPRTSPCRCGENMAPLPIPPLRGCNVVARPSIESSGVDAMQAYGVGGGREGADDDPQLPRIETGAG